MKSLFRFSKSLNKTHLFDYHVNQLKAKMVPFAGMNYLNVGYEMPV